MRSKDDQKRLPKGHIPTNPPAAALRREGEKIPRILAKLSRDLRSQLALTLGPIHRSIAGENLTSDQKREMEGVEHNIRMVLHHVNDLPAALTGELRAQSGGLTMRRLQVEARLSESHALLCAVIEGIPDAIFVKDQQSHYRLINPAGARRLGGTVENVVGKNDKALFNPATAARIRADDLRIMREGRTLTFEETRETQGVERTYLTTKAPHRDYRGKIVGVLGISVDITERRRAEEELRNLNECLETRVAERTAVLGRQAIQLQVLAQQLTRAEQNERERIAFVLHENFQQMLAGAKFTLSAAGNMEPNLRSIVQQVDKILYQAIEESRSLTFELSPPILRYSKMARVLEWLGRIMSAKHGLDIQVRADEGVDPKDPQLRELLFQGVRELIQNVLTHSTANRIEVEMTREDDNRIKICVADRGIGFDVKQYQSQVLAGRKFGLFNIQKRLELMNGRLEMESVPGQGTRMTIMAPIRQFVPRVGSDTDQISGAIRSEEDQSRTPFGKKIRILLADDHRLVRDGMARLLQFEKDFEVVGQAENGREAVDLAHRLHPDIVLMDVTMPEMNGIEATRLVVNDSPDTQVIGLSMHADENIAQEMRAAGAVDYLAKSDPTENLLAAIRSTAASRVLIR